MANSVDPDQTAPLGAVGSGSTLFARKTLMRLLLRSNLIWVYTVCQACLSENLGSFFELWVDDAYLYVQGSPFITLCLGPIELDHVISEPCYKGIILQRNYRKMTIWEPRSGRVITKTML